MRRTLSILAFALLAGTAQANAESSPSSAAVIVPGCKDRESHDLKRGMCLGATLTLMAARNELHICPPAPKTTGQAIEIIVNYSDGHPEKLQDEFVEVALDALHAAWPCR